MHSEFGGTLDNILCRITQLGVASESWLSAAVVTCQADR